jgi:L-fucose isomerase-like protein
MNEPITILPVFLSKPVPTWPCPHIDLAKEMETINGILAGITNDHAPYCTFLKGGMLLKEVKALDRDLHGQIKATSPDGLLVFNLTSGVNALIDATVGLADEFGLPAILFAQPYSGHDWQIYSRLKGANVAFDVLATSDFTEIANRMNLIRTVKVLKHEKLLVVRPPSSAKGGWGEQAKKKFGLTVEIIDYKRVLDRYDLQDERSVKDVAANWIRNAERVVEPTEAEVEKSARLYLACKDVMRDLKATAITIDCLGGFTRNDLPAYPCLTFAQLNDEGAMGVCEADVKTAIAEILVKTLTSRPGFVTDPLFDTSKDLIIHAHCVSATRLEGPRAPAAPYRIRSHMEDNKGASLQVRMEVGREITMVNFLDATLDKILCSTGTIVDVPDSERGCRTKVAVRVKNCRYMLENWEGGLHRVVVYGNIIDDLRNLGKLLQFKLNREDEPMA